MTAVQLLIHQLINVDRPNHINNRFLSISKNSLQEKEFNELVAQANKMFEQQIIDAYANAVMKENNSDYVGMHEQSSGEIYFNETFKKDL